MHVCMYVRMYVCTYVTYVCMHACMHVCMHASMHACTYPCMHVCMYTYRYRGPSRLWKPLFTINRAVSPRSALTGAGLYAKLSDVTAMTAPGKECTAAQRLKSLKIAGHLGIPLTNHQNSAKSIFPHLPGEGC